MSFASDLRRGQAELTKLATEQMVDFGAAYRPTGGRVYDEAAQGEVDELEPLFESVCKVKPPRTAVRESEVGERTSVTIPGEVHLPATVEHASLRVGDVWEVTAVGELSLTVVGRRYRITGEADGTALTACRYAVELIVS